MESKQYEDFYFAGSYDIPQKKYHLMIVFEVNVDIFQKRKVGKV
jgi:hypothetical protein